MAYGIVHHFKGGTKEQYDNVAKAVHPDGGKGLPKGQLSRYAGATPEGWIVVAIWDNQKSFDDFNANVLGPAIGSVDNPLPGPPYESTFEIADQA